MVKEFIFVFLGGGFGASLRWSLSLLAGPMGLSVWTITLLANFLGTLIYFISMKFYFLEGVMTSHLIRIGLCGALTTFSTLSYEVFSSLRGGNQMQAALILCLNILAGVLVAIGVYR